MADWQKLLIVILAAGFLAGAIFVRQEYRPPSVSHDGPGISALPWSPRSGSTVRLFYRYSIAAGGRGPFTDNASHPLLDGAIISTRWELDEPERGRFGWALLDRKISDWTSAGGTGVIISIVPYGQTPRPGSASGDNDVTPGWVYDVGVPRLTFPGGGEATANLVSVPKVWDARFLPLYQEFLIALAARYRDDPRVIGFQLGFGHLGTLNAQPSQGGGEAFRAAGWTTAVWGMYIQNVIAASGEHFDGKPLYVRTPDHFLAGVRFRDDFDAVQRILGDVAAAGVSITFNALTPNAGVWRESRVPELVPYLAGLNPPQGFSFGFSDDWPLWVPRARSERCPSPTCGRNADGFAVELEEARMAWESAGRTYPMYLVFSQPETSATNPNGPAFLQDVYDTLVRYLRAPLSG